MILRLIFVLLIFEKCSGNTSENFVVENFDKEDVDFSYNDVFSYYDTLLMKRIDLRNCPRKYLLNEHQDTILSLYKKNNYWVASILLDYGMDYEPELTIFFQEAKQTGELNYIKHQLFPVSRTLLCEPNPLIDSTSSLYIKRKVVFKSSCLRLLGNKEVESNLISLRFQKDGIISQEIKYFERLIFLVNRRGVIKSQILL